ncbi:MAG: ribonuclease E inhibitor RraB [Paracoccaceae bacterium]
MGEHIEHNYEAQRRDTYATFKESKGVKLPKESVVDYLFFIEELDADWGALEKALKAEGFRCRRDKDGETLVASFGPIAVTPEEIWAAERVATSIALKFDFYPDGWELGD